MWNCIVSYSEKSCNPSISKNKLSIIKHKEKWIKKKEKNSKCIGTQNVSQNRKTIFSESMHGMRIITMIIIANEMVISELELNKFWVWMMRGMIECIQERTNSRHFRQLVTRVTNRSACWGRRKAPYPLASLASGPFFSW